MGGGPRVVVSTAALHARVRGSVPGLGGLKETKMFLPHPRVKVSIVGSLRDREVACSVSDRQGSNFKFCVWRTVSSQSSHHPQGVLLAQFSLYVHRGGLRPDSFHFIYCKKCIHKVEDETHFISQCSLYTILRTELLPHTNISQSPTTFFSQIFKSREDSVLRKLAIYITRAQLLRKETLYKSNN